MPTRTTTLLAKNRKNVLHANFFHIEGFNIRPPTLPEALLPQMARSIVIVIMFIWLAFVMTLVFSFVVIIVIIVTGMTFPAHLAGRILTHDT